MQYTLYDYLPSGNGYKVELTAEHLNMPSRLVEVDILKPAPRTPEFLEKNPNGRIPLLEIEGRVFLWESHAIISFLAEGSELMPADPWQRARVWQWLSFEQYNLEQNVATVLFWVGIHRKTSAELGDRLTEKVARGYEALSVLETGLQGKEFLVADRFTLADILFDSSLPVA